MKRFIMIFAVLFATIFATTAQTVEHSRIFNNTYIGVNGGVVTPFVGGVDFFKSMRPVVGLELGKDITPVFGLSVDVLGAVGTTGVHTFFDQMNVVGNMKFNLSNWFGGYKGYPRRVEFLAVPAIGYGINFGTKGNTTLPETVTKEPQYVTFNPHVQMNINLGKARAWQIVGKAGMGWRGYMGRESFTTGKAAANFRLGVVYKFGYKNSKGVKTHNFTVVPTPYFSQKEVDNAVIEALQKVEPKVVEKVIEKTVETKVVETKVVEVKTPLNPTFDKNKTEIDATSLSYLDRLADEMKATTKTYTLTGYASLEGTKAYNEKLSLNRAEAIKKCLVDHGVSANRLTTVAGGATDKFGSRYEQNRIVVVE